MKTIIKNFLKRVLREILKKIQIDFSASNNDSIILLERVTNHGLPIFLDFSFDKIRNETLNFISQMKINNSIFEYKYAQSRETPNIYSSAYACMILSMFGKLEELSEEEKKSWTEYFNSFQNYSDGLFYDESLRNEIYDDTDWWGARHLALHLINVYIILGEKPKYPFYYLKIYYDIEYLQKWLDGQNWLSKFPGDNDIDNKIMNIVTGLQYQRDYWGDEQAKDSVKFIQNYLFDKVNPATGMWGYYDTDDRDELSRMIQFAYHLFPMFFYDEIDIRNKEKIIDLTLKTQNIYGGFGVKLNSSACEDIDSIDILIRITKGTTYKSKEIEIALRRAFVWILANQNEDGGYVFRRNEPFCYGHEQMTSSKNESALFPTWFRTLTVAYLSQHFRKSNFNIVNSPGY